MEAIVKKYFWTVNLVFLALGAWLLAGTVNVVVAHKLQPLPAISKEKPSNKSHSRGKGNNDNNRVIVDRNYFGSATAIPVEENPEENQEQQLAMGAAGEEGQPSDLRASLVGTVVASSPRWSMAMITDL